MRRFYLGTFLTFAATAAMIFATNPVFADRGGRGGGGGGGDRSSSRSFSGGGGGGGGGSSSRSFSGGGGGGSSSSRSFSGGGSSSRSFNFDGGGGSRSSSMRSFSGGGGDRSPSMSSRSFNLGSGGSSSRSLSGGGSDKSVRSFSGGSSNNAARAFGDSNRGNSSSSNAANAFRSLQSQSDRGNYRPAPRSSGNGNNNVAGNGGGQSVARSFRNDSNGSFQAGNGRGNVDRSQLEAFLNNKGSDRSARFGSSKLDSDSAGVRQTIYGQQFSSNSKPGGRNDSSTYQVHRPTGQEVRDFINTRDTANNDSGPGNNNGKQSGKNFAVGRDPIGNRNKDNGGDGKLGDKFTGDATQRFKPGAKPFDRDRDGNIGKNDGKGPFNGPGLKGPGGIGDGKNDQIGKDFNDRDGRGDRNGRGDWNGRGRDNDFRRDNNFRGGDGAKSEFANWKNVWNGKDGKGRDHRDWSGKWKNGDRFDIADSIRRDWHGRRDHDNFPFRGDWWRHNRHHGWGFWNDYAFRRNRPWYWWGWASAPVLYDWCGFGWSTPYYWDYGPGEYIYCNNGVVFVNGAWYEPAPIYYQQTVQLVEKVPVLAQEAAAQVEWLPLGVFAVTPDGLKEPSVMVQLAVTKDGIIGGTAFDQKAGASYTVQGTVDKNTQRAVWSYEDANKKRIIMETSVNNLTQNESTGLVHYSPNDMRVVEFVRLQEPNGQAGNLPAPPQPQPQPQLQPPQQ